MVDTPAALTEIVLAAFDVSEHLFSLATVDLPSVRNLGVFLQTLDKLRIPSDNISLILNKAERDVGLDIGQITRLFPQGFKAILPYAKEVSRSINMGMPVLASDPTSEVSRKLAACLLEYLPDARAGQGQRGPRAAGQEPEPLQALRPEPAPDHRRERLMKLSERLGAVESEPGAGRGPQAHRRYARSAEDDRSEPTVQARARGPRPRSPEDATPPAEPARTKRANAGWEDNKKRVRDLVLADLGPRLTGAKRVGSELEKEVKAALDRALQREDVRISPVERSKFVAEVLSDILGYGPLDAPLADPSVTEIMCNAYNQIWVERRGVIEPTNLVVHRRRPVPPGDRQDRQCRRPAGRRVEPDGRRPPARRLPGQRHRPAAVAQRRHADDPEVRRGPLHGGRPHQLRVDDHGPGPVPRGLRPGQAQRPGLRRNGHR